MAIYTVVGGGGKVALKFTRLAAEAGHTVFSLVRNDTHDHDIVAAGGQPTRFSLEDDSTERLAELLRQQQPAAVLFAAGAGGKGGPDRTRKVDYDGALKTFDALELAGVRRVLVISAADLRDRTQPKPSHYNDKDLEMSDRMWGAIGPYMQAKYDADLNLLARPALAHIILRPGGLTDAPAAGYVQLGNPHLGSVSRDDVAGVALQLLDQPAAAGAQGLVLDVMGPTEDEPGETWAQAVARVTADKTLI